MMIWFFAFSILSANSRADQPQQYVYPSGGAADLLKLKPAALGKRSEATNCINSDGQIIPPGSDDYRDCVLRKEKTEKPAQAQPMGLEIPLSK